jgi:hypothetical protein
MGWHVYLIEESARKYEGPEFLDHAVDGHHAW